MSNFPKCPDGLIFVFGSNEVGRHGKGAALEAYKNHGAIMGKGVGHMGTCYGIPTVHNPVLRQIRQLPLFAIQSYVQDFLRYAIDRPHLSFWVTRIGCGLAGYRDEEIAPFFKSAPKNVYFESPEWGQTYE